VEQIQEIAFRILALGLGVGMHNQYEISYVPERKMTLIYKNPQKWNGCWGKIFLLFYTFYLQSISDSIYVYRRCHCLHFHNQCPHLPHTCV